MVSPHSQVKQLRIVSQLANISSRQATKNTELAALLKQLEKLAITPPEKQPGTCKVHFRLPPELYAELQDVAKKLGLTPSCLMRQLVSHFLLSFNFQARK